MVPLQEAKQQVSEMAGSFSGNAVEIERERQGLLHMLKQNLYSKTNLKNIISYQSQ